MRIAMSVDEKYELITRGLQEVLGTEELRAILEERDLRIYWGTAITGKPHFAYFLPILKIKDFIDAGASVTVLFADIHGFLDNLKAPIEKVGCRTVYYEKLIKAMLGSLGVDLKRIRFVRGSSFQRSSEYVMDLYKLLSLTSEHDAKKAGAQVVKQVSNPLISSLIYPAMQALDEVHLSADAQFGGVDQRKIFAYARKYLPVLKYKKRIHLMNPMLPGLNSEKMSSSDPLSKIDLMDSEKSIAQKIRKCFCAEGDKRNGMMPILERIIFPAFHARSLSVRVTDLNNNTTLFKTYRELEDAFVEKEIHPGDLKKSVAWMINEMVAPIRDEMKKDMELVREAYAGEE
jgi:tyrosyl-tRNA synthetase